MSYSDLDNKSSRAPNEHHHNAEKLLQDYLRALREHLIYTLKQKLGAAMRTIQAEFVLTVPAIWSEVAKMKTLKACQAAGFKNDGPMLLVSEPVIETKNFMDAELR
jgi:molecular chaperone DnaK (HSP70)